ncbi:MAG: M1 family metallopeptidase [Cyclobacteriaceae bacterium]
MNFHRSAITCLLATSFAIGHAQDFRWQQRVEYKMDVKLDVKTHQVTGTQSLTYFNNSPDTLAKVYYHLYFNAFQPGSMMDVRSRTIADPDGRVMDRISKLSPSEIGYQKVLRLTQDGEPVEMTVKGTVLEVVLPKPILPKQKTSFEMSFEAQVPVQIRRSGRDNKEGIAYSMTQWYPKMAEYDYQGWHAYQYVAREFHGVWGDFDVKITLNPTFTIGGTGILQNPNEIGHGYETAGVKVPASRKDLTWHFVAKNVHDFAWTADPDYVHEKVRMNNGTELHFFYQPGEKTTENWKKLPEYTVKHFEFMNKHFGEYPYSTYSVLQGGDGGIEYPMCTLITGERSFRSLVGVTAHEASHSWYQGVLGSNESLYPWMDEGFTDFSSSESMAMLFDTEDPHKGSFEAYFRLVKSGLQEPMSQHSDHYNTNRAYGTAAYSMGAIFLEQLKYIMGEEDFYEGMRRYYNTWKFRHPEPNDFIRVMEKQSDLQLHWFMRYWINTTKSIDYAIESVSAEGSSTSITVKRNGTFPMPVEVTIAYKDGGSERYYISCNEMLGNKPVDSDTMVMDAWNWVNPTYTLKIGKPVTEIESVVLDKENQTADLVKENNSWNVKN